MKYFIIPILLLFATTCWADNSKRIEELKVNQQKVIQEIQAGQQYIQNKQAEALKLQGAIEILQKLDEEENKTKEDKKEAKK